MVEGEARQPLARREAGKIDLSFDPGAGLPATGPADHFEAERIGQRPPEACPGTKA
jgi:hypothetical protein